MLFFLVFFGNFKFSSIQLPGSFEAFQWDQSLLLVSRADSALALVDGHGVISHYEVKGQGPFDLEYPTFIGFWHQQALLQCNTRFILFDKNLRSNQSEKIPHLEHHSSNRIITRGVGAGENSFLLIFSALSLEGGMLERVRLAGDRWNSEGEYFIKIGVSLQDTRSPLWLFDQYKLFHCDSHWLYGKALARDGEFYEIKVFARPVKSGVSDDGLLTVLTQECPSSSFKIGNTKFAELKEVFCVNDLYFVFLSTQKGTGSSVVDVFKRDGQFVKRRNIEATILPVRHSLNLLVESLEGDEWEVRDQSFLLHLTGIGK